jgi:hypothetical protein
LFVVKLTNAAKYRAFCLQPGYWTLFILDDQTSKALKDRVNLYCGMRNNTDAVYDRMLDGIRFDQVRDSDGSFPFHFSLSLFND